MSVSSRLRLLMMVFLCATLQMTAASNDEIAKLIADKKFTEAETALKAQLEKDKVDDATLLLAVQCFEQQGRYFSAATPMNRLLEQTKPNADLLFRAALISEASADFSRAVTRYNNYFEQADAKHAKYKVALQNLIRLHVLLLNNPAGAADPLTTYVKTYGVDPSISYYAEIVLKGLAINGTRDRFYDTLSLIIEKVPAAGKSTFGSLFWECANGKIGRVAYSREFYSEAAEFALANKLILSSERISEMVSNLTIKAEMNNASQTVREKRLELGRSYGQLVMNALPPAEWPTDIVSLTMTGYLKSSNTVVTNQAPQVFATFDDKVWATKDLGLYRVLLRQMVMGNPPPSDPKLIARLHRYVSALGIENTETELQALNQLRLKIPIEQRVDQAESIKELEQALKVVPSKEYLERWFETKPNASMLEGIALAEPLSLQNERIEGLNVAIEWAPRVNKDAELPQLVAMAVNFYPYEFQSGDLYRDAFANNEKVSDDAKVKTLTELYTKYPLSADLQKLVSDTKRYFDSKKLEAPAAALTKLLGEAAKADPANVWSQYPAFVDLAKTRNVAAYSKMLGEWLTANKPVFNARGKDLTPVNVMANRILYSVPGKAGWNDDQQIEALMPLADRIWIGPLCSDLMRRNRFAELETIAKATIARDFGAEGPALLPDDEERLMAYIVNNFLQANDKTKNWQDADDALLPLITSKRISADLRVQLITKVGSPLVHRKNDWGGFVKFLNATVAALPLDQLTASAGSADALMELYRSAIRHDRKPEEAMVEKIVQIGQKSGVAADRVEYMQYQYAQRSESSYRRKWLNDMAKVDTAKLSMADRRRNSSWMFDLAQFEGYIGKTQPGMRNYIVFEQWLPLEQEWLATSFEKGSTYSAPWSTPWNHTWAYYTNYVQKTKQPTEEWKVKIANLAIFIAENLNMPRGNHLDISHAGMLQLAENGDYPHLLESVLVNARAIRDGSDVSTVQNVVTTLKELGQREMLGTYLSIALNANKELASEPRKAAEIALAELSVDLGSLYKIPVAANTPEYDLYLASQKFVFGDKERAVELLNDKYALLTEHWQALNPDFVVFALDHLRKTNHLKEAYEMCKTILLSERNMPAEMTAGVLLVKADITRDKKDNNKLAELEYKTITNNKQFANTSAGKDAQFHLIELYLLTSQYPSASALLTRLIESGDRREEARAYYFMARMEYEQDHYELAKEHLQKVFIRTPNDSEAKLLKGNIALKMGKPDDVLRDGYGQETDQIFATPGEQVRLTIRDQNLAIARANSAVPVLVTTSGGDSEIVKLRQAEGKAAIFEGYLMVRLGKPVHNNTLIEVTGDEILTYQVDPVFQRNQNLDLDTHTMSVVSIAKLKTSSGEFVSEEERLRKQKEMDMLERSGEVSRQDAGRDEKTIRPGNPIHVRVIDPDRSISEKADTVYVRVETKEDDMGDLIEKFPLVETEPYSGIFEGKVKTGKPLPQALASDTEEGSQAGWVINKKTPGMWVSGHENDGKKWFEVDLQEPQPLSKMVVHLGEGQQHKRLSLLASRINNDFEEIATYPEVKRQYAGGLDVYSVFPERVATTPDGIRANLVNGTPVRGILISSRFEREKFSNLRGLGLKGNTRITGYFYLEEAKQLTMRHAHLADQTTAFLYIDGRRVDVVDKAMGGDGSTFNVLLGAGVHEIDILMAIGGLKAAYELQYLDDKGDWTFMPKEWFSSETHPELSKAWEPKARLSMLDGNLIVDFESATRYRQLRMMFKEYVGDTVSIKSIDVIDRAAKQILPADDDFSTGRKNDTLEIAAGDAITVTYIDEKYPKLTNTNYNPELKDRLKSSFYNAKISLNKEIIGEQVSREARFYPVKRVKLGNNLMILVEDWDLDATDQRDTINVTVEVGKGAPVTLKALESEAHSGVFQATLKFAATAGPNQIALKTGDEITLKYFDSENTDPGVGVDRVYKVFEAGSQKPEILVLSTQTRLENVNQILDKNQKRRGGNANSDDRDVLEKQIIATFPSGEQLTSPRSAVDAPLLFLVRSPSDALDELSTIEASVISKSEREANAQAVPMKLRLLPIAKLAEEKGFRKIRFLNVIDSQRLEMGLFAGIVNLQLGLPGDPKEDKVFSAEAAFGTTNIRDRRDKEELNTIPTVLVQGNDQVELTIGNSGDAVKQTVGLFCDGQINFMDRSFEEDRDGFYLGETLYLRVIDYDLDTTKDYDAARVKIVASGGDSITVDLKETLPHSGIFSGSVIPQFRQEKEQPNPNDEFISLYFGEEMTATFTDSNHADGKESQVREAKVKVYLGSDGQVNTFSKMFKDEEIAVKTAFTIAEAYFELAKEHRKLNNNEIALEEIATGKRLLEEALATYPNTNYAAQAEYLLANLAEEQGQLDEAIGKFTGILQQWPDSDYAPKAQFHLALCYEKMEPPRWDEACDEYVKITYRYPNHPLVADVIIRLGQYFWKIENFMVAGDVFKSFQKRFPEHNLSSRAMLLSGQSYIKAKEYRKAIDVLNQLTDEYVDDKATRPEAMYWLGDSYRRVKDLTSAYKTLKKLTWDYPETKWAKMARGLLVGEEFRGMEDKM